MKFNKGDLLILPEAFIDKDDQYSYLYLYKKNHVVQYSRHLQFSLPPQYHLNNWLVLYTDIFQEIVKITKENSNG